MTDQEIKVETIPEVPLILREISKKHLGLSTLESQHSDAKDFHDLAVWSVKAALLAAFEAGQQSSVNRGS